MVAGALVNKGIELGQLGRRDEAVAVYDDVVARFGAASELALRERVARALVYKGANLGALGRRKEAIATYDEVTVRFDASDVSSRRDFVQDALWQKGNILFDDLGDFEGAESAYSAAVNLARRSTMASGNYAWLLLTTLRVAEARDLRAKLENLPLVGLALLDAGLELAGENFGSAVGNSQRPWKAVLITRRSTSLMISCAFCGSRKRAAMAKGLSLGLKPAATPKNTRRLMPPSSPLCGASGSFSTSAQKSAVPLWKYSKSSPRRAAMLAKTKVGQGQDPRNALSGNHGNDARRDIQANALYAAPSAAFARSARLRSFGSSRAFLSRIDFGVTSTSSSSWM